MSLLKIPVRAGLGRPLHDSDQAPPPRDPEQAILAPRRGLQPAHVLPRHRAPRRPALQRALQGELAHSAACVRLSPLFSLPTRALSTLHFALLPGPLSLARCTRPPHLIPCPSHPLFFPAFPPLSRSFNFPLFSCSRCCPTPQTWPSGIRPGPPTWPCTPAPSSISTSPRWSRPRCATSTKAHPRASWPPSTTSTWYEHMTSAFYHLNEHITQPRVADFSLGKYCGHFLGFSLRFPRLFTLPLSPFLALFRDDPVSCAWRGAVRAGAEPKRGPSGDRDDQRPLQPQAVRARDPQVLPRRLLVSTRTESRNIAFKLPSSSKLRALRFNERVDFVRTDFQMGLSGGNFDVAMRVRELLPRCPGKWGTIGHSI